MEGVSAAMLMHAPELDEDAELWEGLDEGSDEDYLEALEAYVEVCCAETRCDKR